MCSPRLCKQVNILRYVTRRPVGWTHLLKTDDDCYVRMQHIIRGVQASAVRHASVFEHGW